MPIEMVKAKRAAARKTATSVGRAKTRARTETATGKTKPRSAALVAIRVPAAIRKSLGEHPADAVVALLALREAVGSRSVEDLRVNPFMDVRIDAVEDYQPFATSTVPGLRKWSGTQRALIDEAVAVSHRRVDQLAHAGLLREAATEVQNDYRRKLAAKSSTAGSGIEGVRDETLLAAVAQRKTLGRPVSASTLRTQTGVGFRTCSNFLARRSAALGLHLQPDGKTYSWTAPATPKSTEPTANASAESGVAADGKAP